MIEQGLFKRHFVGRDGFIWWIGQVVSEGQWITNIPGRNTDYAGEHKGFDYRYRVRIMGYHTADPNQLSDNDLPWASVMLPVTSGGGPGGMSETPTIVQGNFVYGFFLDGEDAQQPIIMGIIGFNQYTNILDDPGQPFEPFNGYNRAKDRVAKYSLRTRRETPAAKNPPKSSGEESVNSRTGNISQVTSVVESTSIKEGNSVANKDRGEKQHTIPKTSVCEKIPLGTIQLEILSTIKEIEKVKKSLLEWESSVSTDIQNAQRWVEKKIQWLSEKIAAGIEWIVTEIQRRTIGLIQEAGKLGYFVLFPSLRESILKDGVNTAMDLLICNFRRILGNIYKLVFKMLIGVVGKIVNVTECFVRDFVGAILGSILNDILSAVTSALGAISGLIGSAVDIAESVLGIVTEILSYLTCDTPPECPEIDTFSFWNGPEKSGTFDFQSLFNQVQSFASNVTGLVDGGAESILDNTINSITGTIDNAIDGFNVSPLGGVCGVGPFLCGAPTVEFFGGGGSGASGNAVVGLAGEILGVNITSPGSGYNSPPMIGFKDSCGRGTGAVGKAIMQYDRDILYGDDPIGAAADAIDEEGTTRPRGTNGRLGRNRIRKKGRLRIKDACVDISDVGSGKVVAIVITQPGLNYLRKPNGSLGGGGRTYAEKNQTIVRRSDGCYDLPYNPGETIELDVGDWVKFPSETPIKITEPKIITSPIGPELPDEVERDDDGGGGFDEDGEIPLIDDIYIDDPGFDYDLGDCIVVNGECIGIVTSITPNGSIEGIELYDNSNQYFSYPEIFIDSKNGFNAKVFPIFKFYTEEELRSENENRLITTVIDCVGKIPPS